MYIYTYLYIYLHILLTAAPGHSRPLQSSMAVLPCFGAPSVMNPAIFPGPGFKYKSAAANVCHELQKVEK